MSSAPVPPESSPPFAGDLPEAWYTVPEAARLLGVSPVTVRRWIKSGRLNRVQTGRRATRVNLAGLAGPPRTPVGPSLETIVTSSESAIITKTLDGTITGWNASAERLYGYTAAEVLGRPISLLLPGDRQDELPTILGRLARGERIERYETRRITRGGRLLDVSLSISPLKDAHGRIVGAATIVHDVSERVRLRRELEQALAAARFLDRVSSVLAGSLDYETTLQSVARLAVPLVADRCMVDIVEEGVIRRVAVACADPAKDRLAQELRRFPPRPEDRQGASRVLKTGRAELHAEVDAALIQQIARGPEHTRLLEHLGVRSYLIVPLTARERILGVISLVLAESGRRYGPDDLRLAEQLAERAALAVDNARLYSAAQRAIAARDAFLSVTAHELRTPLATLRAHAQLALRQHRRQGSLDVDRTLHSLRSIQDQSVKLSRLIDQLLDLSRIESDRLTIAPVRTDLAAVLAEAVEAARLRTTRHALSLQAPPTLEATVDPLRLEQVFANLLENACKYSPAGGPIEVALERGPDGAVRIAVRDHGVGIPAGRRARIFERFYRAHGDDYASGVGIGLFVSRQIVEQHGGELTAEFPPDGGTRFVVQLPPGTAVD